MNIQRKVTVVAFHSNVLKVPSLYPDAFVHFAQFGLFKQNKTH